MTVRPPTPFITGLGLFAMFFGAGNVVFPLFVGLTAGDGLSIALVGLLLTGVALPLMAILAMVQHRGQHKSYFAPLGEWAGKALLLLCLFLLGPFLVIPRTITVAYAALQDFLWHVPLALFSLGYCIVIGLLALNAQTMLKVMGKIFTPVMLGLLGWVIFAGWRLPAGDMPIMHADAGASLLLGLKEGYFTLDAIAALIFGQFVYVQLKSQHHTLSHDDFKRHVTLAAVVAGVLLALVYVGLAYISHKHGNAFLQDPDKKQALLILLTIKMLPAGFGSVAGIIIASACITTACALSSIFADYLHHAARHYKLPGLKSHYLLLTLVIACGMSLLGFSTLMASFAPVIVACYPVFILLTVLSLCRVKLSQRASMALGLCCLVIGIATLF